MSKFKIRTFKIVYAPIYLLWVLLERECPRNQDLCSTVGCFLPFPTAICSQQFQSQSLQFSSVFLFHTLSPTACMHMTQGTTACLTWILRWPKANKKRTNTVWAKPAFSFSHWLLDKLILKYRAFCLKPTGVFPWINILTTCVAYEVAVICGQNLFWDEE